MKSCTRAYYRWRGDLMLGIADMLETPFGRVRSLPFRLQCQNIAWSPLWTNPRQTWLSFVRWYINIRCRSFTSRVRTSTRIAAIEMKDQLAYSGLSMPLRTHEFCAADVIPKDSNLVENSRPLGSYLKHAGRYGLSACCKCLNFSFLGIMDGHPSNIVVALVKVVRGRCFQSNLIVNVNSFEYFHLATLKSLM